MNADEKTSWFLNKIKNTEDSAFKGKEKIFVLTEPQFHKVYNAVSDLNDMGSDGDNAFDDIANAQMFAREEVTLPGD